MRITLGPKEKRERRIGQSLGLKGDRCVGPKCAAVRRPYPPGVHGPTNQRPRITPFGLQLREKQKAQLIYGLAERQLRNYVKKAAAKKGDTGLLFSQMLENRLDNVVYRLGFARSRGEAREYVSHAHFLVNGEKVNIPSFHVRVGDVVEVAPKSAVKKFFTEAITPRLEKHELPSWLIREGGALKGRMISIPAEEELPKNFDRTMIIEFYSR